MTYALYVHIPFCARKCVYCDFVSVPYNQGLAEKYVSCLVSELIAKSGAQLSSIYFGGGTPTALSIEAMSFIFDSIRPRYVLEPNAEVTVEANPGTLNREKIDHLLGLGVSRISLGIQSFDDGELTLLGRAHTGRDARDAARIIAGSGALSFSLDLLYGIPGQTLGRWERSLKDALSFGPKHVSAYELTPEKRTPLYSLLKDGRLKLPPEDAVADMFELGRDVLEGAGLRQYEISNYALPGHECRHNLNYWQRGQYLGVGVAAHSFMGGVRSENTPDLMEYIRRMESGESPVAAECALSESDALKETIFLGLRMRGGIDLSSLKDRAEILSSASSLISAGFMEHGNGRLALSRRGMALASSVIVALMRRMEQAKVVE